MGGRDREFANVREKRGSSARERWRIVLARRSIEARSVRDTRARRAPDPAVFPTKLTRSRGKGGKSPIYRALSGAT